MRTRWNGRSGQGAGFSRWIEEAWQDSRYAVRTVRGNVTFTTVVVLTLTLGIGVNTAIFSLFSLFFQPLAVKDPASIVNLDWGSSEDRWLSFDEFGQIRRDAQSLSALIARADHSVLLGTHTRGEEPARVAAAFVSDNYLAVLGAGTVVGRSFLPQENGLHAALPTVLLSQEFWLRRFGGNPAVVRRSIQLGDATFTVAGVTAAGFAGLNRTPPDVWLPLLMRSKVAPTAPTEELFGARGRKWLLVSGRLASGRSLEHAAAELAVISRRLRPGDPMATTKTHLRVTPGSTVGARRNVAAVMGLVLASTLMVLLIACSNIANLMLARGAARRKELGMRLSVGASRTRLVRQLLTESLLLAALGGAGGLFLAWWSVKTFLASTLFSRLGVADPLSVAAQLDPDWRVLVFTLALSVLTGVAFGVMPALRATRGDLIASLQDVGRTTGRGRTRSRMRDGLIVAEVALCFVLLVVGGLLLRGLTQLEDLRPGFRPSQVLAVQPRLDLLRYEEARAQQFHRELAMRLGSLPGVQAVTRVGSVPLGAMSRRQIELDSDRETLNHQLQRAFRNAVASNYFEAVEIPILRGRGFTEEEARAGAEVVVVTLSSSRRLWPDEEPIGRRLRPEPGAAFAQVIGVAQDVDVRLDEADPLFFYMPLETWAGTTQLVRAVGDLRSVKEGALAAVRSLDPHVLVEMSSVAEMVAASNAVGAARAASLLAAGLGLVALLLAGVGLYGVMAYSVAERTGEMGVRMALGATQGQVQRLIIRQGLRLVAVGAAIGLMGGANAGGLLSSLMFGLSPFDPIAYGSVAVFLTATALVATWVPARRATAVEPIVALRSN